MIDLRSDTVTKPTAAMRRAMAEAEVGDDVYGEDPTVNRLEERAAEMLGKDAALFVPTGTMGNTIGIKLHTKHGQEVICDHRAHILDWEMSMTAWFAGCLVRSIVTDNGILQWPQIEEMIRPPGRSGADGRSIGESPGKSAADDQFCAPSTLLHIENPHNMGGGTLYGLAHLHSICDEAHAFGLKVHLDGARIFNAAAATGETAARIAAKADTVMFCLSKGLAAPVGSMLVGTADDIRAGRQYRKRLGGGMRQAGVLAAAGLVALEESPKRLHEDHANARALANCIAEIPGVDLDLSTVCTNMVLFDIARTGVTYERFSADLKSRGVLVGARGGTWVRVVTHQDVSKEDCEQAAKAIREVLSIGGTG